MSETTQEGGLMEPMTICMKCKNFLQKDLKPLIQYLYFCGAITNKQITNMYTGKQEYQGGNKHPFCFIVNDGNCKHFEGK